jgi:DNA-binding MarR family transcriptional regulator
VEAEEFIRLYPAAYYACHGWATAPNHALTMRQIQILSHIDESVPVRPTDLATHLGTSLATVSVALDRLEVAGFLRRVHDDSDHRAVPVVLTSDGRAAMLDSSPLDLGSVERMLALLSADDRQLVRRALLVLQAAAAKVGGER